MMRYRSHSLRTPRRKNLPATSMTPLTGKEPDEKQIDLPSGNTTTPLVITLEDDTDGFMTKTVQLIIKSILGKSRLIRYGVIRINYTQMRTTGFTFGFDMMPGDKKMIDTSYLDIIFDTAFREQSIEQLGEQLAIIRQELDVEEPSYLMKYLLQKDV